MDFLNKELKSNGIAIIDYGSQYTQLIARRVRELGVFSEILNHSVSLETILQNNPRAIILSGGPNSVFDEKSPTLNKELLNLDIPILGICYGMQLLANELGGEVKPSDKREYGLATIQLNHESSLFKNLNAQELNVWMSHGDSLTQIPEGFKVTSSSSNTPFVAMEDANQKIFGIQFHPEVTHTEKGETILSNFIFEIAKCKSTWQIDDLAENIIRGLKDKIGDSEVLLGLSGGVDSSVVAGLLHKAIGDQLTCIFVDNGLLRLNERNQVEQTFKKNMDVKLVCVDASEKFLDALKGVTDPEEKRKIIGNKFIEVFEEESARLEGVKYLAQGTIYPDVIESAGGVEGQAAHVIKSHHNVGGLPEYMMLDLVEPLRSFFKDEVRSIGSAIGIPDSIIHRHPFPGPGLGVRILNEVKREYADKLRLADHIFIEELISNNLYHQVSQAFAVYLPIASVGVVGDGRAYEHVIALRAVETKDFMTANWARLPYDFLERVSLRIINEVRGVSRVVYDISGKPPATIEWE